MYVLKSINKIFVECKANVEKRKEAIKRRWEERRFQAVVWRDYQLECAQRLYETEVEAVEKEFEEERARLKEKLIGELLEERKRLMDELEPTLSASGGAGTGHSLSGSVASGASSLLASTSINQSNLIGGKRMLRKRTGTGNSNGDEAANTTTGTTGTTNTTNSAPSQSKTLSGRDTQRRRTAGTSSASSSSYTDQQLERMGIETRLNEGDIEEDLNLITANNVSGYKGNNADVQYQNNNGNRTLSPERRRNKQAPSGPKGPTAVVSNLHDTLIDAHVTSSDSLLHYNHCHVFQRGDPISVLVTQSDSTFSGTISTIGPNELWIRREDGTKNKIYLGQLRIGKYMLAPPNTPFP
jgi:hypothetical protein